MAEDLPRPVSLSVRKVLLLVSTLATGLVVAGSVVSPASGATALPPERLTNWGVDADANANWTATSSSPESGKSLVVYFYTDDAVTPEPAGSYFAQVLGPDGTAVGGPQLISNTGVNIWGGPAVAWNPTTGGWLVCWPQRDGSGGTNVLCNSVAPDGTPGASAHTVIPSLGEQYTLAVAVWNPERKEFLVTGATWNASSDSAGAAFVKSTGEISENIGTAVAPDGFRRFAGAYVAYSATSKVFGITSLGEFQRTGEEDAPWFWLIDVNGTAVSDPVRIDPNLTTRYRQAGIAWSPTQNEFVVSAQVNEPDGAYVVQRFSATDGQTVGGLKSKPLPLSEFKDRPRQRPLVVSNPFSNQTFAFMGLAPEDADDKAGLFAMPVAADGELSGPELITGASSDFETGWRPSWTFNPFTCGYLGAFRGVQNTGVGTDAYSQLYSIRLTQEEPCKASLSVTKKGTGTVSGTATESGVLGLMPQEVGEGTTELYRSTSVTLEASPAAGSSFKGWSGACSGTGPCTVSMSETRSVEATFATKARLRLSVRTPKTSKAGRAFNVRVRISNIARRTSSRSSSSQSANTAKSVKTCARLPRKLFVVDRGGGKVRGRTICWNRSSLALGKSVTYTTTVRSSKTRSGSVKVTGTVSASNASGATVKAAGSGKTRIIKPKAPKPKPPTG